MEKVVFGRTGLEVSPAGLGCGGYSRLGMRRGNDEQAAEGVVRHAMDLGINFFDTARVYGTEEVVGRAIAGRRDEVVISSKTMFRRNDDFMAATELVESLEKTLTRLSTDYIDVFSLHGVTLKHYPHCVNEFVPALQRQQQLGKIRHLGITESFQAEPRHDMLIQALKDDLFDVIMVGFNFLNASARDETFELSRQQQVATQIMHAVRNALSNPEKLKETVASLVKSGEIDAADVDEANPLGFLAEESGVGSVTEVAYRYCRHEPGVDVVLTGTGSKMHLSENAMAIASPPLPESVKSRLDKIFGRVKSVSGD